MPSLIHWFMKLMLVNTKVVLAQTTDAVMALVVAASVVWLIQVAEAVHVIPNVVRLLISYALNVAAIYVARLTGSEGKVSTSAGIMTSRAAGLHRFDTAWTVQELHGGTLPVATLVADLVGWNGTLVIVNAGLA